jgi:glycosyltransferase involved in cell wall biosynthesis
MRAASSKKVAVTMCVSTLEFGGVGTVVYALATGLDPSRYAVRVFSLGRDYGAGEQYRAAGIPVFAAQSSGRLGLLLGVFRLWRFLRREGIALIHTHPGSGSRIAAFLARVPVVVATYHGSWDHWIGPAERLLRRVLDRRASAVVANSCFTRDRVNADLRHPPHRVRVIYNGVNPRQLRPPSPHERDAARASLALQPRDVVVVTVARLYPDKGVADLLSALALARSEAVSLRLLVVGDGPERGPLLLQSASLGLEPVVRFLGLRADILQILRAADVFVLASRTREGFGIALAEAMAMALPVIGTRIEGIPELVEAGRAGLLVPPRNPVALKNALVELARRPERRRELGSRGRAVVEERFDVRRMVAAYAALYEELLSASQ